MAGLSLWLYPPTMRWVRVPKTSAGFLPESTITLCRFSRMIRKTNPPAWWLTSHKSQIPLQRHWKAASCSPYYYDKTAMRAGAQTCPHYYYNFSISAIQTRPEASLGIFQSPRGPRPKGPAFAPSGMQLRLNCWVKNLQ